MGRPRVWPPKIYGHPSGRARVRINNVDYYLGPLGSEQAAAEYRRIVAEVEATGHVPAPPPGPCPSVRSVLASWKTEAIRERGADSPELVNYTGILLAVERVFGDLPAAKFGPVQVEELRVQLASGAWRTTAELDWLRKRNKSAGWCRNNINRNVVRIGSIWRWAERRELVPAGSYHRLKTLPGLAGNSRVARSTPKRRAATYDDLRSVRKVAPRVVRYMLTLQWWTGMRSAEVRTMRVGDVDRSGDVWVYRPGQHKGTWRDQDRAVPLGRLSRAIVAILSEGRAATDYVFRPARRAPFFTRHVYARAVKRAALKAGVALRPYDLRHGFRMRVTREMGLDFARAAMGHKSLSQTAGYGDAVDLEAAKAVARRIG